jgi:hypothetical protein
MKNGKIMVRRLRSHPPVDIGEEIQFFLLWYYEHKIWFIRVSTLTIEIWHRVCRALRCGIYAILDYALVEFAVPSFYEIHCATVSQSPTRLPDSRANEISKPCGVLDSEPLVQTK